MTAALPRLSKQMLAVAVAVAVALGAGIAWAVFFLPGNVLGRAVPYTFGAWLGSSGSVEAMWGSQPLMAILLSIATAWKIWLREPGMLHSRGHGIWLIGFLFGLLALVTATQGKWQSVGALSVPWIMACGIGWVTGSGVLRRLWVPVLLTVLIIPPQFLGRWYFAIRSAAADSSGFELYPPKDGFLQILLGPSAEQTWAREIHILTDYLPYPPTIILVTAVCCWVIPRRICLKAGLVLVSLILAFLEMSLQRGC